MRGSLAALAVVCWMSSVAVAAEAMAFSQPRSYIDLNSAGADYVLYVEVAVTVGDGNAKGLACWVYDENTGLPTLMTNVATGLVGTPVNANGFHTVSYKIPKASGWGQAITNGQFAQAWCTSTLTAVVGGAQTAAWEQWVTAK